MIEDLMVIVAAMCCVLLLSLILWHEHEDQVACAKQGRKWTPEAGCQRSK